MAWRLSVPRGDFGHSFGGSIALFVFNFIIGGVIGGFVLLWRLIVAVWYVPLTAYRMIIG